MTVIERLQDLLGQVPEILQPVIIAVAGMIPFVEGEVSSLIGVWGGLHPVVAGAAGAAGNFLSVLVVVTLGSRIREAVIARRARRARTAVRPDGTVASGGAVLSEGTMASEGTVLLDGAVLTDGAVLVDTRTGAPEAKPESKGRRRLRTFVVRFGVPGASLLGPLALPTQLTAATLVASGVSKRWVLLWQAVAIVLWTTFTTVIATGVLAAITAA